MVGRTLMIQGTSSSAGKSLLTAALCRCFARWGIRVAPFKAQNMSNNAAVCADGAEIGRSQALQAIAAGVAPTSDMNPILLKPEGDKRSQVIINGLPLGTLEASEYFRRRSRYWSVVTSAVDRLRAEYELVVIEGAGSPAELNLTDVELVNMSVARYCQSPVILVGDIERGGVFAQLLGTLWLLTPEDRLLVRGMIVNKFRGDLKLFDRGVEILQQRGGLPVLGVLPWIDALRLPEEDAVALIDSAYPDSPQGRSAGTQLDIAVIQLPHIANFDDFDPLASEPAVRLRYIGAVDQLGHPGVIIIPGTKNTLGDLNWLRVSGLSARIIELAEQGVIVVGICGGYQMLGRRLNNPDRVESDWTSGDGLGLLDVETVFHHQKQTCQVRVRVTSDAVAPGIAGRWLTGYEIHAGHTQSNSNWLSRDTHSNSGVPGVEEGLGDGAVSRDGRVWGCYLHGLFHNDAFRAAWLATLGIDSDSRGTASANQAITNSLDQLADAFEAHVDMKQLEQIVWNPEQQHASV